MPSAGPPSEEPVLDRGRRFLHAWATLLASLIAAAVGGGGALELAAYVGAPEAYRGLGIWDHPLMLAIPWSAVAAGLGVGLGAPFVLFRRYIVRPDAPFLRLGYLVVAAAPLALSLLLYRRIDAGLLTFAEPALLIATMIYVGLARRWRVFAPSEWR